jgi:succinate-acetate transporter protein
MIAFYIPSLGVTTAYETTGELDSALAIYLSAWGIVTLIFLIVCLMSFKYNQKLTNNRHHYDLPLLSSPYSSS